MIYSILVDHYHTLGNKSMIIFEHELQNAFFQRLMHGGSHCLVTLKALEKFTSAKPLPMKLFLQMDNCVKDNKNYHLLAFLSFLIITKVFEEVQLGFLIVSHTHEDIDGNFGYLSKTLKEHDNYVLANVMKAFMVLEDCPFILQLIQEILDLKTWVKGCLKDGPKILQVGRTDMHLLIPSCGLLSLQKIMAFQKVQLDKVFALTKRMFTLIKNMGMRDTWFFLVCSFY
jgi:hypothetical protein